MPDDLKDELYSLIDQRLTPLRLTVDRLDRANIQLEAVVYGDQRTQQPGLLQRMAQIEQKLDQILDSSAQRTWLLRGLAAGVTINLLQSTGLLSAIFRALAGAP